MIKITKDEAEYIRAHSNVFISVTGPSKRSRNKNRYVTETRKTWKLLNEFRNQNKRKVYK